MKHIFTNRRGVSLVELLVFLGIFALCSGVVLALFFATTEHRVRQQVIMSVEQGGLQLLQTLTHRIRTAEEIVDPPMGGTGAFLALQVADESLNPTIFTASGSNLLVAQGNTLQTLNRPAVSVADFWVENTSTGDSKQSVTVHFTISNIIPIPLPTVYERTFQTSITVFPDHVFEEHCACATPACSLGNYAWEICQDSACSTSDIRFLCNSSL